jgi:hypothetical protein
MFRDLFDEDDPAFVRGRTRYEEYLTTHAEDSQRGYRYFTCQRKDNDIYHLTFLLNKSTTRAGYTIQDTRVETIVKAIYETQRPDGGWKFWADESYPQGSVWALNSLVWTGSITKTQLGNMIRRHGVA